MGRLYDACHQVITHIDHEGLDVFRTRGAIAMQTGFLITLVEPDDPDDQEKLDKLVEAADEVLGLKVSV